MDVGTQADCRRRPTKLKDDEKLSYGHKTKGLAHFRSELQNVKSFTPSKNIKQLVNPLEAPNFLLLPTYPQDRWHFGTQLLEIWQLWSAQRSPWCSSSKSSSTSLSRSPPLPPCDNSSTYLYLFLVMHVTLIKINCSHFYLRGRKTDWDSWHSRGETIPI